jgi:hypothetical protein
MRLFKIIFGRSRFRSCRDAACRVSTGTVLLIALSVSAKPFAPINYSPKIDPIEIDADKCPVQIFVSPNGNDSWSGVSAEVAGNNGPFATLDRAREEVRKLKAAKKLPKGGVAVNLRGGIYSLKKSFELNSDDSGTDKAPVVYRHWKEETVQILGGRKLTSKDFKQITNSSTLAKIDSAAKGKIVQLDAKALGLTHISEFPKQFSDGGGIFELFFNGKRMPLSRWPDVGNTTMQEVITVGEKNIPGAFVYRDNRAERWDVNSGVWLKGFWRVGWENPAIKLAAIDKTTKQISFVSGIHGGIGSKYHRPKGSGKEEWYAINLLEEITKPGEWCIDFNTGTLYFWPPADLDKADVMITQLDQPIVTATGLSNTAFVGLTFEGSLGDGIVLKKSNRNLIAGCTFRNLGGTGVVLDGEKSGIQSCDMYALGKGCIVISGGSRENLTESGNYVVNNHLHDYAVLKSQYSAAIDLYVENKGVSAVGILVSHNLIHHAPRDGVLFAGNKNVFEFNEIHRCGYATADVGAFYSCLDWTIRGVVIRYNYLHNTVGGVNPDDGSSGSFVYGNILAGDKTGVWIAGGPDHTVQNNIFIKSEGPVFGMDERGKSRNYATNKNMLTKLGTLNLVSGAWKDEFPEMATFLERHPELPQNTKFVGNLIWIKKGDPTAIKLSKENKLDTTLIQVKKNFVTAQDPGFEDAANGNFKLKKNAAVYQQIPNFPVIPVDKIGLYIDKYRKVLPTPSDAGRLPEQNPWAESDKDRYFGT